MSIMRLGALSLIAFLFLALAPAPRVVAAQSGQMPITTSSKEALAIYERAQIQFENVELAAARPLLEEAIAKDPKFAMAYVGLAGSGGGFVQFQKNSTMAIGLIDSVSPGEKLVIMALKAQVNNDPTARREHAEALVKMFPKDKHAHFFAGQVARANADLSGALQHYKHAVSLDKKYAAAYNMLGYTHIALGDMKAAESDFKDYIKLRRDSANPYDSYGELLQKMGRFDDSTAQYQMALAKDKSFSSATIRIGDNNLFKGDGAAAREWYRKAFDAAVSDADRVTALGATRDSYVYQGMTTEALATNQELLTLAVKAGLEPAVFGAHMSAAFIQLEAGKPDEAKPHVLMARVVSDAATTSQRVRDGNTLVSNLAMARVLSRANDTSGSDGQVEGAKAIAFTRMIPAETRAIEEAMALIALDRKQYDVALQHFAKGELDDGFLIYYTGVAYDGKGDTTSARKKYNQAAVWNQPDLGYATVRTMAVKKAGEKIAKN